MRVNKLPQTSQPHTRGSVCVVIAAPDGQDTPAGQELLQRCLDSVRRHSPAATPVLSVPATTTAVKRALEQLAPADVVVLSEPCRVTPGWLERLREAARGDTNTATASALADFAGELALCDEDQPPGSFAALAEGLAVRTLGLHPRLTRAVGPCVYVRREALELVGPLDDELDLVEALELDFAQRCLRSGLAHVAADDVVVQRLEPARATREAPPLAESAAVLEHTLRTARGPRERLWVTLDARALDGAVTGTQVHILELIDALARTGALRLRLLIRVERIDRETLELLRGLPETELLAAEALDPATPRSTVFHRPQQTFSPGDVALAVALGERIVLSQLDLIAYRNPGYFTDADAWEDYRRASRHGLSAAERVVVFSDHTRRELLSDALVDAERIRVVPPGLDHRSVGEPQRPAAFGARPGARSAETEDNADAGEDDTAEPPRAADAERGEETGFLLCLGTDFRHKNRVFALRLLAALRVEHDWQGRLVLAGTHIPQGSSLELERAFLREHPELREAVTTLGPVDEREKAWLVAHAGAVVYPSVYEGFGLVPFESALSGVPCVFAPQSSLAEAAPAGTATIVPWDPGASAAATFALLTDPGARARHVQALAAAARELTWTAAASAIVEIYREAALAPVRDAATLSRDAVKRERRLSVVHELEAARLVREREHAQRMYDELNAEVGSGLSLIGPHGTLPDNLQRALLALSARPALSRPIYGGLARLFAALRAIGRAVRGIRRRGR